MDTLSEKVTLIVISCAFLITIAIGIVILVLIHQKKQIQFVYDKNLIKAAFDKELLSTQLEIQEQTLKNISQEIHDNIGQVLSLAKLNINTMSGASPVLLEGKISDSKHLISKAIQDLRDLSRSLNTDYVIDMGLLRSVEYELELIKRAGTIETALKTEGKPYRLEQQQELILFRIVQEILHNIIKHAKATLIDVYVQFEPERFSLTVSDNGIGFDASKLDAADYSGFGLGIRNMHNRAKMIGTDFTLTSTLGKGVTVSLNLPITNTGKLN